MGNDKISIILPCYNVAPYIEAAVKSIRRQTYKNYEVIFINDGSTDDTLEKIQQYGAYDNFHVYSFANQGVAQARNEGIRVAKGEYLYFMDPDDVIEDRLLETALEACEENHADAVQFHYFGGGEFNGNKGNAVYEGEEVASQLLPRFIGYPGSSLSQFGTPAFYDSNEWASVWRFLFKASVVKDNHILFPKGVTMSEDRFFVLKFLCYAGKVVAIDKKLYHYLVQPTGGMSQGLQKAERLLKNKMDGVVERRNIRQLMLERRGKDVFGLYSGSLVLSCLELYVKLSELPFREGWKAICQYSACPDVKEAIGSCRVVKPLKLAVPVMCMKLHLGGMMYAALWLFRRYKRRLLF